MFSSVLSFKQEKLQDELIRNYGPTSFTGTINENFSNDKTSDKIYESLGTLKPQDFRIYNDFRSARIRFTIH